MLGNVEADDEDIKERNEEMDRQMKAIGNIYNQPDILDYKTKNKGLLPYLNALNVAKMGPEALMEYHRQQEE